MKKFILLACIALLSVTSASALTSYSPPQKTETYIVQADYDFVAIVEENSSVTFTESTNVSTNVLNFAFVSDRTVKRFGFVRPAIDYENSSGSCANYNFNRNRKFKDLRFIRLAIDYENSSGSCANYNFNRNLHSTETVSQYLMSKPCIRFLSCSLS